MYQRLVTLLNDLGICWSVWTLLALWSGLRILSKYKGVQLWSSAVESSGLGWSVLEFSAFRSWSSGVECQLLESSTALADIDQWIACQCSLIFSSLLIVYPKLLSHFSSELCSSVFVFDSWLKFCLYYPQWRVLPLWYFITNWKTRKYLLRPSQHWWHTISVQKILSA